VSFSKEDKILVKSWHELKVPGAKGLVLKFLPKRMQVTWC